MTNFNLDYTNLDIRLHDSIVWATYDAHMSGLWQGDDWGGDFILTNIFIRENGEWKIAHLNESRVP